MSLSARRKLLYSALTTLLFLALVEGALALIPALYLEEPAADVGGRAGAVVCVGDSVTAGVGLPRGQAWPDHLERQLLRHDVAVVRVATPGSGVALAAQAAETVAGLPADSRPAVLVMLGHNDALRWEPGAKLAFEKHRREAEPASPAPDAGWRGPRLWRILRWGWGAIRREQPSVAAAEDLAARFPAALAPLRDAAAAKGGRLVLLTYLVPGPPPEGLDPALAAVIEAARLGQAEVNAALRRAARELPAELLDLEREIPVGARWDTADFLDHIHLSAEKSAQVAAEAHRWLRRQGAIPGEK